MSEKHLVGTDEALLTLKDRINYPYILSRQLITIQEAILAREEREIREAIDGLVAIIPTNYKKIKNDPFEKEIKATETFKMEKESWCGFPLEGTEHKVQSVDYFKKLQACTDLLGRRGMLSRTVFTEIRTGEWVEEAP